MINLQQLPSAVKIMAVTKGHSVEEIEAVLDKYSITVIGENRWQEAQEKLPYLSKNIEKHFIGHVQRNKLKEIMHNFDVIESIDSFELLQKINDLSKKKGPEKYPIFLQVNISDDPNKHGFLVEKLGTAVERCKNMFHVELLGLMAITAKQTPEQTRKDFHHMKQLQGKYHLRELSMGMSDDWQIAVEEGTTIVRLGKTLFE